MTDNYARQGTDVMNKALALKKKKYDKSQRNVIVFGVDVIGSFFGDCEKVFRILCAREAWLQGLPFIDISSKLRGIVRVQFAKFVYRHHNCSVAKADREEAGYLSWLLPS